MDGTSLFHHTAAHLPPNTWDFSFLSNRAYMLASCAQQGSIEVYSFQSSSESTESSSVGSTHVASLMLPDLQEDIMLAHLSTHTGPFHAKCDPGKVFTTSLDPRISRIHVVTVQYTGLYDFHPRYCFFLHNRTLLSYIPSKAPSGSAVTVPWKEWGPKHTRFFAHHTPYQWLRYVQGQRVVTPPYSHEGRRMIQVFDFNVHASRTHAEYDYADGLIYNELINCPSHIPRGNIFKDSVMTYLPYHAVSREDPQSYSGFMIDEERIIGLKSDAFADGDTDDIDVFTF